MFFPKLGKVKGNCLGGCQMFGGLEPHLVPPPTHTHTYRTASVKAFGNVLYLHWNQSSFTTAWAPLQNIPHYAKLLELKLGGIYPTQLKYTSKDISLSRQREICPTVYWLVTWIHRQKAPFRQIAKKTCPWSTIHPTEKHLFIPNGGLVLSLSSGAFASWGGQFGECFG